MNDRKPPAKKDGPAVEVVVRRPVTPTPAPAPAPRPAGSVSPTATPRPTGVAPTPTPTPRPTGVAPRPTPAPVYTPAPRSSDMRPRPAGRPGFGSRPSGPRLPVTTENINALAKRERVPARIARGELEGKMKCRIWKKLHAEEARRFDQVYTLLEKQPTLELADGFGIVQSGMSVEEFLSRKARSQRRTAVKQARTEVDNTAIDAFIRGFIDAKTELSFVLGERTVVDTLLGVEPIAFKLERTGRLEKLQVVLLAPRFRWEALVATLPRDPRLAQKPTPVAREPERRPFSDPRIFQDELDQPLQLTLRNGLQLEGVLRQAGRFDLLLELEGDTLLIPIHAILRFERQAA